MNRNWNFPRDIVFSKFYIYIWKYALKISAFNQISIDELKFSAFAQKYFNRGTKISAFAQKYFYEELKFSAFAEKYFYRQTKI